MRNTFKKNNNVVIVGFIFFLLFTFFMAQIAVKDIKNSNYYAKCQSVSTIMNNIGQNLDLTFEDKWKSVHKSARHILNTGAYSKQDLVTILVHIQNEEQNPDVKFYVIDEKKNAFYADGSYTHWKYANAIKDDEDSVFLLEKEEGVRTGSRMVYITPFEEPLYSNDTKFTHLVFSEPMDAFNKYFETTDFSDGCLSFIIKNDGTFLYENDENELISKSQNFHVFVGNKLNVKFLFNGIYKDFYDGFQEGARSGTYLVEYNNVRYYLAFYNLSMENWYSVMMIPEKYIEASSSGLMNKMTRDIGIIFLATAIIFVAFVLILWKRTSDKQKAATEAEHRSVEAKLNFLSSMSHDIRTPMNAIMGMTQIALYNYKDPILVKNNLEKINTSSLHLLTLINDILDISKIEFGKMPINSADFSLKDSLENIISMVNPLALEKNIDFIVNVGEFNHYRVHSDELRINQICINLLTNAIKYTQNGGKVSFDIWQEEIPSSPDFIRQKLMICDNGIGMSEEFQKNMYDAFSREVDSRVNKIAGSGLGLAICSQIVSLLGGKIECKSELGIGTTFTVTLALEKAHTIEPSFSTSKDKPIDIKSDCIEKQTFVDESEASTDSPTSTISPSDKCMISTENDCLKGMHVLVAEDNDMNYEVIEMILDMRGVISKRANNGQEAIDIISSSKEGDFGAILMDVRMPIMDGRTATKHIRSSSTGWIREIPIVAMTADAFAEDIEACLDAGMDAHLAKPIDQTKLYNLLAQICKNQIL